MRTASGGFIARDGTNNTFSIEDIALGLSRQPRFAGQTRRHWTVLHHTLSCYYIASHQLTIKQYYQDSKRDVPLTLTLLHDAHEAFLGDCPSTLKDDGRKKLEWWMDGEIARVLGVPVGSPWMRGFVKSCDSFALHAEGYLFGPVGEVWRPSENAVGLVETVGAMYRNHADDEHAIDTFLYLYDLHRDTKNAATTHQELQNS